MKKLFFGIITAVIVSAGIFTFAGCEKEESTEKALNIQKSNAALTGMYEVVDETGGVFLDLEDSNYISMSIVREPASGTGGKNVVKDDKGNTTGINWYCNRDCPADNCGDAREIDDETGKTIRTGTWVETDGGLMIIFEPNA